MKVKGGNPVIQRLAPKLGPLGISAKKAKEIIGEATKEFNDIKVLIELTIKGHRIEKVEIIPTASSLIYKAVGRTNRKEENEEFFFADLTLVDIIDVSKELRDKSSAKTFKGTVLEVLGTCQSCGVKIEGSDPKIIQQDISIGKIELPKFE